MAGVDLLGGLNEYPCVYLASTMGMASIIHNGVTLLVANKGVEEPRAVLLIEKCY